MNIYTVKIQGSLSHLLQMRGLKLLLLLAFLLMIFVASFTDAWIETKSTLYALPSSSVASFTDAWIETSEVIQRLYVFLVASFTDAWIETAILNNRRFDLEVASFTDAWIETLLLWFLPSCTVSRIFYRCVD